MRVAFARTCNNVLCFDDLATGGFFVEAGQGTLTSLDSNSQFMGASGDHYIGSIHGAMMSLVFDMTVACIAECMYIYISKNRYLFFIFYKYIILYLLFLQ